MTPGSEKWPDATQATLEYVFALLALQATSAKQDDLKTVMDSVDSELDDVRAALDDISDKTPSTADIEGATAVTTLSTNSTVVEVASGSGWLHSVSQLLEPYAYGTNTGLVTVTIDGVSLGERPLSIADYAGSYPGDLVMSYNISMDIAIKYETSLKVEHRITKGGGTPEVNTTVIYTED